MRLASLFTGGKDSTYATILETNARARNVEYLVTMRSERDDSWMFHTVNIHITPLIGEALGIKCIISDTRGEKEEELEDLKKVLSRLDVDGVVSGAIASKYQKNRIDRICKELNLSHVTPLWGRSSFDLLKEMLSSKLIIMVTSVAAQGLDKNWLGRILDTEALEELRNLNLRYGVDVCGEGGEMETLVLDSPWYSKKVGIIRSRKNWDGIRGSFYIEKARLISKSHNS